MRKEIVFVFQPLSGFGCIPEAFVLSFKNNKIGVDYVRINKSNFKNFEHLANNATKQLVQICFDLEKDSIIQKSGLSKIKSWDEFYNVVFKINESSLKAISTKDFVRNYIETKQNKFFELLNGNKLFLQKGKLPFMWKQLFIEEEMPEVYYYFNYNKEQIKYSLECELHNKKLSLTNATLISRNRARILIDKKIYEFESEIDGAKLIPFFSKDEVIIEKPHIENYIEKIILPLVYTNKVVPEGFDIICIDEIDAIIMKAHEIGGKQQLSLFDDNNIEAQNSNLSLDIEFKYQEFNFNPGRKSKSIKFEKTHDSFLIKYVERDIKTEKYIVSKLKELGLCIENKPLIIPIQKGLNILNDKSQELYNLGIEIIFTDKKDKPGKLFLGERKIELVFDENLDWFDIKAKILFGEFEIPFLRILNLIKQNKTSFLLPNGELAQIPEWLIEEYKTIFEFVKIENGTPTVPKRLMKIALEKEKSDRIKINIKDSLRNFFLKEEMPDYELPTQFKASLRPYQLYGYKWLRNLDEVGFGGFLADDMGLGKTVQTLALIQWLKEVNRGTVLLIVPTSLVFNWINEINKFCQNIKYYEFTSQERIKNETIFNQFNLIITTYSILRRDIEFLSAHIYDYCILDESQYIKNPKSDTANACQKIKALHYLCITGTPIENSVSDLWSQMNFLNQGMLGSLNHFSNSVKDPLKADLYRSLIRPFLLRRRKEEVLQDLPKKIITVEYSEMTFEQYEFYKEIRNRYRDRFIDSAKIDGKVDSLVFLEGLMRLRQAANHPVLVDKEYNDESGKFEHICMKIQEIHHTSAKVLIYSSFVEYLKLIKDFLLHNNISFAYIDGSVKDREEQINKFNSDPESKFFLLSLKAGGLGLNLTAAQYVFLLDPWWNPAAEAQAFDRAHRIGQTKTVFIYKFISRLSIEEKILKLQSKKLELFDKYIESEIKPSNFSIEEVLKLIDD
jgi:SNF2 family DNA or RNA helicase